MGSVRYDAAAMRDRSNVFGPHLRLPIHRRGCLDILFTSVMAMGALLMFFVGLGSFLVWLREGTFFEVERILFSAGFTILGLIFLNPAAKHVRAIILRRRGRYDDGFLLTREGIAYRQWTLFGVTRYFVPWEAFVGLTSHSGIRHSFARNGVGERRWIELRWDPVRGAGRVQIRDALTGKMWFLVPDRISPSGPRRGTRVILEAFEDGTGKQIRDRDVIEVVTRWRVQHRRGPRDGENA